MQRALLFGSDGQLGTELRRAALPLGWQLDIAPIASYDFARPHELQQRIEQAKPNALLNAAAYTAVDKAESEPELAEAINALAPQALGRAAANLDIPLLHVSTDYVFDGELTGREYVETDTVRPLSVYGASKEHGESLVRSVCPKHVILRTSWVFSSTGANFVKTMLRLGRERDELRIVDDQFGRPTHAGALADAMVGVLAALSSGAKAYGTFHYAGNEAMSWRELAERIFATAAAHGAKQPRIIPIGTHEYPTPAKRPKNSRLDGKLLQATYGIRQHDFDASLKRCIAELMTEKT